MQNININLETPNTPMPPTKPPKVDLLAKNKSSMENVSVGPVDARVHSVDESSMKGVSIGNPRTGVVAWLMEHVVAVIFCSVVAAAIIAYLKLK